MQKPFMAYSRERCVYSIDIRKVCLSTCRFEMCQLSGLAKGGKNFHPVTIAASRNDA